MKFTLFLAGLTAASVAARILPKRDAPALYTLKLSPTEVKQVTEEEKWALKAEGKNFFDITEHPSLGQTTPEQKFAAAAVSYPSRITHQSSVTPLLSQLSTTNLQNTLTPFTQFQNRYYNSTYGVQSSAWLLQQVQKIITDSGATGASAKQFKHSFLQNSVIATIPGKSNKTIVMGAHQDSINSKDPNRATNRAPGADDDGSGSMTILEAMRVLLKDEKVRTGQAPNTIEFHWYAAEEAGILGSTDIWQSYKKAGKNAKAMLQQDMTGYSKGMKDRGEPEVVGVITDYVDTALTNFIKITIDAYCDIGYVETECGYACSDHAAATTAGYPSSFVFESPFDRDSPYIHTANDSLETVDYQHMLQHAKMTVGFAYELAFAADL